ncbi:MAG: hypothetical protein QOJ21_3773 [Solirubrobacteraceae bacterium]|nr:hypothetical protein [Solirubrobacteraceae bacterium]
MPQPPSPEHGPPNVVDSDVLAVRRRARHAELGEDAALELRLFDAERRLGEVAAERDALKAAVDAHERDLRSTRQREWAEQQQRLEAQGEAAATRELAGGQVAELRERLAEAEAEVAVLAAERDRARATLEDARAGERVERDRRAALEREHLALRAELERRETLTGAAAAAVADARRELERERAARADTAGLEQRLTIERQEFAARVAAVEGAVAAVRERLGAAASVLRERLDAERAARATAEAALAAERADAVRARSAADAALAAERDRALAAGARAEELERELARRAEVEAQLRTALDALHRELEAVRAGDGARSARLAARVESVVAIAAGLRDGVRRELSAEQEAFAASLTAMQARVAELQEGVAAAVALGTELEEERAARWVAEAELDAERRRGEEDRAARAFAEARLVEVEAELEELRIAARPASAPDPEALASLRDALAHLRTGEPDAGREPSSLGVDLAAAAARLRSTAQEAEAAAEAVEAEEVEPIEAVADEPEPELEPVAVEPEPEVAVVEPEPEVAVAVEPEAEPVAVEPDAAELEVVAVEPEPGAPADSTPPPADARVPLPPRPAVTRPAPWLRDALTGLAVDEPDIAELLFVALLPAQGGTVKRPMAYELAVEDGTTHRVSVGLDRARVELPGQGATDARVSGPLAALVPLAAGGAGRRLPGTRIEGRRALRRVLKARRGPLGLAELAAAGVAPSPGLLLTVLARAVPVAWTIDRELSVDIAPEGADTWRVIASGRGPLTILPADPEEPAAATLHTSASRLPAVLAGTAEPGDAWVGGDLRAAQTLLSWLDRAQRGER